jgi:hypothetical protein
MDIINKSSRVIASVAAAALCTGMFSDTPDLDVKKTAIAIQPGVLLYHFPSSENDHTHSEEYPYRHAETQRVIMSTVASSVL